MSASTRRGWWKAPTRFLPWGELIPVLPPTELSTWASSVVGICTKPTPRRRIAAAKPARSPITPPPKATTRSSRATFSAISHSTAAASACPALGRLARRQFQHRATRSRPPRARLRSAGRCRRGNAGLGQDRHARAAEQRRDLGPRARQQPGADADVVGALAERHGDGLGHAAGSSVGPAIRPGVVVGPHGGDDRAGHRLVAGAAAAVDGHVGLGVDRRAAALELGEHRARVGRLQQRPAGAVAHPVPEQVEIGAQPDRGGARLDLGPGARLDEGAAAGGEHAGRARPAAARSPGARRRERRARRGVAKISGIDMPAASTISVSESANGHAEQRRQPLADAGLARAHQPDQHQGAA